MRSLDLEPPPPPRICIAKHLGNKGARGFAAAISVLWFVFGRRFGALLPRGATCSYKICMGFLVAGMRARK